VAENIPELRKRQPAAHGGGVRGDQYVARSSLFEGRFGRMFRSLPPAVWPVEALMALGATGNMTSEPETGERIPAAGRRAGESEEADPGRRGERRDRAGYTYLGQFIDHDITFDPASSLQQQNDPWRWSTFARHGWTSTRSTAAARRPAVHVRREKFRLGGRSSIWTRRRKPAICPGSAIRTIRTAPSAR
jgi:hypothetical protein